MGSCPIMTTRWAPASGWPSESYAMMGMRIFFLRIRSLGLAQTHSRACVVVQVLRPTRIDLGDGKQVDRGRRCWPDSRIRSACYVAPSRRLIGFLVITWPPTQITWYNSLLVDIRIYSSWPVMPWLYCRDRDSDPPPLLAASATVMTKGREEAWPATAAGRIDLVVAQ